MESGRKMSTPSPASKIQDADHQTEEKIEERQHLTAPVVYEVIRRQGEEELERPASSLWWSGIAAGLALSLSVLCKALLHMYLPDEPWRPLISNFGYCVGFVIVILGSLQLFTEQTVTAILPVLAERTWRNVLRTARLWGIVLAANMAGAVFAAAVALFAVLRGTEEIAALLEVSRQFATMSPLEVAARGTVAGFLIGALVWMLPSSRGSEFWVIVMVTYFIGVGHFSHIVAGAVEVFLLMWAGELSPLVTVSRFIVPALIGNIIGGTVLFSLIAYGQVRQEMED